MKIGDTFMFDSLQLKVVPITSWGDCEDCYGEINTARCGVLPVCREKPSSVADGEKFLLDTDHEPTVHRIALMRLRGEL